MRKSVLALALSCLLAAAGLLAQADTRATRVDAVFARWSDSTPGCAVAVSEDGREALSRAYGMANLEHDVRNTPETIFEAGSVSKQFTAAAVLLLARDGKLSLDDPIRKYISEVPDYGAPLSIRQMLNHTSGLRDWGSIAGIAGWPRTTRAYTHAHVLDIVSRQRTLNFPSGTRYSYSNSGFNLAAMLVERVSGMSFADFTAERIFTPLKMTSTSWRDDYRRVVKGRAVAYGESGGSYRTLMPFENVHGNGGLLTTVGDLLTWNQNFVSHIVGDAEFVREMQTPGRFNDGRSHGYALGLMVGPRFGLREVSHSGSTAGYNAHLTRFPDQRLSVAVLCNTSNGRATQAALDVAAIYLGDKVPAAAPPGHFMSPLAVDRLTGLFRSTLTGEAVRVTHDPETDGLRLDRGAQYARTSNAGTRFVAENGDTWESDGNKAQLTDRHGSIEEYERVEPWTPAVGQLAELTGLYVSEEAELMLSVAMEKGALVLRRRPDSIMQLTPLYRDAFSSSLGTVIFTRGSPAELSVVQDRVWDLRFTRQATAPGTLR